MEIFLRPLFGNTPEKIYNLTKATELQKPVRKKGEEESQAVLEFGDETWMEEEERLRQQKLAKYEDCLLALLQKAMAAEEKEISLEAIRQGMEEGGEEFQRLFPNVQIFKEVMVELLRGREIDIQVLREERRNFIGEFSGGFQLNEMLLNLIEEHALPIHRITVYRIEDGKVISFENVPDQAGRYKNICCSNVLIRTR